MIMVHRFTSPSWFAVLQKYVPIPSGEGEAEELFKRIIRLRVGEALVFAPSGLVGDGGAGTMAKLGSRLLRVKARRRLTWDGGKTIVCV